MGGGPDQAQIDRDACYEEASRQLYLTNEYPDAVQLPTSGSDPANRNRQCIDPTAYSVHV